MKDPASGQKVSWLSDNGDKKDKPWHLGCVLCHRHGFKNAFGKFQANPKLGNILRHSESSQHVMAVSKHHADDAENDSKTQQKTWPFEA